MRLPRTRMVALSLVAMIAVSFASVSSAEELSGTLKKIKETNTITVGHRTSSMPISYMDNQQQPLGYAVDICKLVIKDLKKKLSVPNLHVNWQHVSAANRIPLLRKGATDLQCGSGTITAPRLKVVSFGPPYYFAGITAIVKTDSGIKTISDLRGKTVAVTTGTTAVPAVVAYNAEHDLNLSLIKTQGNAQSFLMLQKGRVSAYMNNGIILYGARAVTPENPEDYYVIPDRITVEPFAMIFRKDDPQFEQFVDESIASIMKSGKAKELYNKWFMSPIPPNGVNLSVALSEQLQKQFKDPVVDWELN